ncbi:MAG: GNAT family N-acetyltransferase [Deltaproteobacteria bacterium]|nr:GNAT family N-acetyltransferase [Deltaproteobacteria bacterium]
MRIQVLTSLDELRTLRDAWEGLCEALRESVTPFSSYDWYEVWWKHYSAGETLHTLAGWEGERLVGVAPLMLRRATMHGLPLRVVCFIENNQSFLNDFIVAPGANRAFLEASFDFLCREASSLAWDAVVLNKLSTRSPNYSALLAVLDASGWKWREEQTIDARHIVPLGTWEEFFAGRSTKARKTLRNIQNTMRKAGVVSVRRIQTWKEFEGAWHEIRGVARGSWTEELGDSMASAANEPFFLELAQRAAQKGWLSAWTLTLDGRTIAVEFHLRAYCKEFAMRGHYLPEYAKLSPGTFLEMEILREIYDESERLEKYDFGNYYEYKRKWTDNSEPHMAVSVFNDRLYSKLAALYELRTVPLLRSIFPAGLWQSKLFKACGINTDPFRIKQH